MCEILGRSIRRPAHRRFRGLGRIVAGGDLEYGDELGFFDFDLGDVGFDDGFLLALGAVAQDVGQVSLESLRWLAGWVRSAGR